jgi:hypothetical protein
MPRSLSAGIDVRVASLAHASSARETKVRRCAGGQLSSGLRPMSAMEAAVSEEQANVLLLASCTSAGRLGE